MNERIQIAKIRGIELNGMPLYEAKDNDGKRVGVGSKEELLEEYKDRKIIDWEKEERIYNAYIELRSRCMEK